MSHLGRVFVFVCVGILMACGGETGGSGSGGSDVGGDVAVDAGGGDVADMCGQPCGLCSLGQTVCGETGMSCRNRLEAYPPVADPSTLSCADAVVYVDTGSFGEENGTREAPFSSLEDALSAAAVDPEVVAVVVGGSPTFLAPIEIREGVSVYGGFEGAPAFTANDVARPRVEVESVTVEGGTLVGLMAEGIRTRTVVSGVTIENPDLGVREEVTNVGAYLYDSPGVVFADVVIRAGDAGSGEAGRDGEAATVEGTAGEDGAGDEYEFGPQDGSACPAVVRDRPAGGEPADTCKFLGRFTAVARGGAGGLGQLSGYDRGRNAVSGGEGGMVAAGEDGVMRDATERDGRSGDLAFQIQAGMRPRSNGAGTDGKDGLPGEGGGGGSSGYGVPFFNTGVDVYECYYAADGGGGGGGGCGGEAATGGGGGGWSVGIAAVQSDGFRLVDVMVEAGNGGDGGVGGRGGDGAAGGAAGDGGFGRPISSVVVTGKSTRGYDGGDGAVGQRGGHGGNGAGGSSHAVWCDAATSIVLGGDNQLVAGEAGSGGYNPGTGLSAGEDGRGDRTYDCN